ncbi:MAG: cytochrome-c peroxidase [Saprospiraceae bacterium]
MKKAIYLFGLLALAAACSKKDDFRVDETPYANAIMQRELFRAHLNLPENEPLSYQRKLPNYLRSLGMEAKPVNNWKATLGRVLFYDKNLSSDRTVSCASCHRQSLAFSDNKEVSRGIGGQLGTRNSQPLANVATFSGHYRPMNGLAAPMLLWDNRALGVEEQAKIAFENPHEMNLTMPQVVERIREQPYYQYIWGTIYGDFEPKEAQVLECLAEFVGAMGSHNSKLDVGLEMAQGQLDALDLPDSSFVVTNEVFTPIGTAIVEVYYGGTQTMTIYSSSFVNDTIAIPRPGIPTLTPSENEGRKLFVANCTKCHAALRPVQEVFAACNGLDVNYKDPGLGGLTGNPADVGVFKSPSLRNIALTAPYMHDGRFKTLEEVVNFYSTGVQDHPNLHPALRRDGNLKLNLTPQQKADLVAFLKTMTDQSVTSDTRFSNPFK